MVSTATPPTARRIAASTSNFPRAASRSRQRIRKTNPCASLSWPPKAGTGGAGRRAAMVEINAAEKKNNQKIQWRLGLGSAKSGKSGASDEIRTHDSLVGNERLYH